MSEQKEVKEVPQGGFVLTAETLQALISTAIAAAKAPNVIEQKKLDDEEKLTKQAQEDRQRQSMQVLEDIKNKGVTQRLCSHEHKNGDTHCVYIQEKGTAGYFICQKNQCIIRPGVAPAGYSGNVIYDTTLFNKMFQKQPGGEIFG